jgi:hypothetical protein
MSWLGEWLVAFLIATLILSAVFALVVFFRSLVQQWLNDSDDGWWL